MSHVRWENYLLTLCVIPILCFLLYFPGKALSVYSVVLSLFNIFSFFSSAILFSILTLLAIVMMCVGRCHGQTKANVALTKVPEVKLLDSDYEALVKLMLISF